MEQIAFNDIEEVGERHLHILWTNSNPVTSENMVLMYATNAMLNRWWDKVTVVLWGDVQRMALEDEAVSLKIMLAKQAGVRFSACISCSRNLGLTEKLQEAGIETVRWGERISLLMQNGKHILSI